MLLKLLGTARLETQKLSNLQLLILSYLYLENEQNRNDLANLFFAHLDKPRESLRVAIAKLNQKIGKGSIIINNNLISLSSDCESDIDIFRNAIEKEDYKKAHEIYESYFFTGLEQDSRIELTDELQAWLFDLREEFAEQIRNALIILAKQAKTKAKQKSYAEKAFLIEKAPEFFFEELEELAKILKSCKSRFSHAAESELNKLHAEGIFTHLNQKDKNLLLAMALTQRYQLSNSCLERAFEQDSTMLLSFRKKLIELLKPLNPDEAMQAILATAQEYLDNYSNERNHFALKLAQASNNSQKLFQLYEDIYKARADFGNAQELPLHSKKINQAYKEKVSEYLDKQDFQLAENLLSKVRKTLENLGLDIDQENLFLEAYALERQGQFAKALAIIEDYQDNDKLEALKSVLLLHAKNLDEAKNIAEIILSKSEDTWTQALSFNTLGTVAVHRSKYYKAIENFSKSGIRWKLVKQEQRYLGSIMNQANCYSYAQETTNAIKLYDELLGHPQIKPKLKSAVMLNKADMLFKNKDFKASEAISVELIDLLDKSDSAYSQLYCRALANLAYTKLQLEKDKEAKTLFEKVTGLSYDIGDKFSQAHALFGIGAIEKNLSQLEDAINIFKSLNHNYLEISKPIYINIIFELLEQAIQGKNQNKTTYLLQRLINFLEIYNSKNKYINSLETIKNTISSSTEQNTELYKIINEKLGSIKLYLIR